MKQATKRALGIFLALMMIISALPSAFALENDIKGHWAEKALESFVDSGYLTGDGKGNYDPDGTMTRAQFAAILNRLIGLTAQSAAISTYTDVEKSDWYYADMAKALSAGYMSGTSATTMSPDAAITREQAFTMLARYLGLDTGSEAALASFADATSVSAYARGPVAAMISAGYVEGTGNKVNPHKQLTRAEGVTVLYRTMSALKAVTPVASDLKDGVYTGTGSGYGGTITVQMTVSGGKITKLQVLSHSESNAYYNRAKSLLDTIVEKQGTDGVDTVSGATKSSRGILTAVNACISQAKGGQDTSTTGSTGGGGGKGNSEKTDGEDYDGLQDGVYEGSAKGYSGTTTVRVTVSSGKITDVEIVSHGDSTSYFDRAKAVVDDVISSQSTDVDAVTNATYSSWGILNAINDALKDAGGSSQQTTLKVSDWEELTEALAKAQDGDTIVLTTNIVDAGQVDAVSSATATINKSVTIEGNDHYISAYRAKVAKNTTDKDGNVSTEMVNPNFCFNVTGTTGIQIQNLTIRGASFSSKLGGAMYVESGAELTLDNVTFENCKAGSTGAGNGGAAIYAEPHRGSSPTVTAKNCTFVNNMVNDGTTGRGGAVYGYNANIILQGCSFTGNKAGFGGAVAAAGSSNLTVTDCVFDSSNEARYGGDDMYVFDGYTFYKKTMATDSAVSIALSGNTFSEDGKSFEDYRVICGRVLGEVCDTTSSAGNTISGTYSGNGSLFLIGHDLTFSNVDNYERKNAPSGETENGTYRFLLVNIPYADFYQADLNNDVAVDAFTSATKAKPRTGTLAGGSYHESAEGKSIDGVTFPVAMTEDDFARFRTGRTEITDESSVTIEVTNRGKTSQTTYAGKDALFESASYSYYVLEEEPAYYKKATVAADGSVSFGKVQGISRTLTDVKVSLSNQSSYGDYQLSLADASGTISASSTVYGIILQTKEGSSYGLRHMENIWRGTSLAFCTGFTTMVHNCPTSSAHYAAIMGQTITGITYLTKDGIYEIPCEIYVPIKTAADFEVTDAAVDAKTTAIESPAGFEKYAAAYTVTSAAGEDVTAVYGFSCDGRKLTWSTEPMPGAYTLTITDTAGKYAPVSASFVLNTSKAAAGYDNASLALKAVEGTTGDAFQTYLAAISQVTVDGKSYAVSGRNAVKVINDNGYLDLNAQSKGYVFADLAAGKTYAVTVQATGYPTLTFTVSIPENLYAYASLTYAEYWENEKVYAAGDTESCETADNNGETDKGAFDTVTRATSNHGLHRGSFQQSVTIYAEGRTYQPLYWVSSNSFVDAADGKTYDKTQIGMTKYEITGIKYVPVSVAADLYQDFCKAYTVTQNGEALQGGYTENQLKSYSLVADVTAATNGLKAAARSSEKEWSFGARQKGTDSGILGEKQAVTADVTVTVKDDSKFGDFIRVDITGSGYGALGDKLQTVKWEYYASTDPDDKDAKALVSYGTKFAADDWMHKSMGVQLGLTESLRCQLPDGTDGSGYWKITVYALGYEDFTTVVKVGEADLHGGAGSPMTEDQKNQLTDLVAKAKILVADYNKETATEAQTVLKTHYDEAVSLLDSPYATSAKAKELLEELPGYIKDVDPTAEV